jgi:hypothetical protein
VWLANAANHVFHSSHQDHFVRGLQPNVTTNISLWAPYFRNVSAGEAWMIPSGALGLGPRAMQCQCFNPDGTVSIESGSSEWWLIELTETCCIAQSNPVAPFCIPKNSTCCFDTFCDPGETCCGDSCCPPVSSFSWSRLMAPKRNGLTESLGNDLHLQSSRRGLLSQGPALLWTSGML